MRITRSQLKTQREESAAVANEINRLMRQVIDSLTTELNDSHDQQRVTFEEVSQMVRKLAIDDLRRIERESSLKLKRLNLPWIKAASVYFALGWTPQIDRKVEQIARIQKIKSKLEIRFRR